MKWLEIKISGRTLNIIDRNNPPNIARDMTDPVNVFRMGGVLSYKVVDIILTDGNLLLRQELDGDLKKYRDATSFEYKNILGKRAKDRVDEFCDDFFRAYPRWGEMKNLNDRSVLNNVRKALYTKVLKMFKNEKRQVDPWKSHTGLHNPSQTELSTQTPGAPFTERTGANFLATKSSSRSSAPPSTHLGTQSAGAPAQSKQIPWGKLIIRTTVTGAGERAEYFWPLSHLVPETMSSSCVSQIDVPRAAYKAWVEKMNNTYGRIDFFTNNKTMKISDGVETALVDSTGWLDCLYNCAKNSMREACFAVELSDVDDIAKLGTMIRQTASRRSIAATLKTLRSAVDPTSSVHENRGTRRPLQEQPNLIGRKRSFPPSPADGNHGNLSTPADDHDGSWTSDHDSSWTSNQGENWTSDQDENWVILRSAKRKKPNVTTGKH